LAKVNFYQNCEKVVNTYCVALLCIWSSVIW